MNIFSNIDTGRFVANLRYMWEGMICIFIVIGVIILSVYALGAISKHFGKNKKKLEK